MRRWEILVLLAKDDPRARFRLDNGIGTHEVLVGSSRTEPPFQPARTSQLRLAADSLSSRAVRDHVRRDTILKLRQKFVN